MILCICNNLDEEDLSTMTWDEHQEVIICGTCVLYCKNLLCNSFNMVTK